jgi:hypothetical protein
LIVGAADKIHEFVGLSSQDTGKKAAPNKPGDRIEMPL